jgi:hypothetical protein
VQSTVVISLHNDVATLHPDHHQRKQLLPPNYTTATDAAIINSVSSSKSNTANATTAFVKRSSNNHHQLTVTMPWQVQLRFIPNQHQRKQLLPSYNHNNQYCHHEQHQQL